MSEALVTVNELIDVRVMSGQDKSRRIGKIQDVLFHPTEARAVGFMVKRPDFLLTFKRKDQFVSIQGYGMMGEYFCVRNEKSATDRAACEALGIDLDDCVCWVGLPILTQDGENLGMVGDVTFSHHSGTVHSIEAGAGALANFVLGKRTIPAHMITGFQKGIGVALTLKRSDGSVEDEIVYGALLVADEAREIQVGDGLAKKAGKGAGIVAKKARKVGAKVSEKAGSLVSEKTAAAAESAGKVVGKGLHATGKQIGKTRGMFTDFKNEYKKARHESSK